MKIGGVSVVLLLGIVNLLLVLIQLSSGLRWVRVKMTLHRKIGILLFFTALLHGFLAYLSD